MRTQVIFFLICSALISGCFSSLEPTGQTVQSSLSPSGTQRLAMVLVTFRDSGPVPFQASAVDAITFGADPSVRGFFEEASYGTFHLEGRVFDWVTIPHDSSEACTPDNKERWTAAAKEKLLAQGFSAAQFDVVGFVFPQAQCARSHAIVGRKELFFFDINFNSNQDALGVVVHEIGHLLSLQHSSFMSCVDPRDTLGTSAIGEIMLEDCDLFPSEASNTYAEYGDFYDLMGKGGLSRGRHFNAFQKLRLGWLKESDVENATCSPGENRSCSADYRIAPLEFPSVTPRALRIHRPNSFGEPQSLTYYLEYRQPSLYDSLVFDGDAPQSVLLHLAYAERSFLVDASPATPYALDHALPLGGKFQDEVSGLTFEFVDSRPEFATLRVTVGPAVEPMSIRNAASFSSAAVAPQSAIALFGTGLPTASAVAANRLTINDLPTPMLFVSSTQINAVVPSELHTSSARVRLVDANTGALRALTRTSIAAAAPGLFTVSSNGTGVALGRVTLNGGITSRLADEFQNPIPVSLRTDGNPTELVLLGTGMRNAGTNVPTTVRFKAPTVSYVSEVVATSVQATAEAGLDEVRVFLPASLPSGNTVFIEVATETFTPSNQVKIVTAP